MTGPPHHEPFIFYNVERIGIYSRLILIGLTMIKVSEFYVQKEYFSTVIVKRLFP